MCSVSSCLKREEASSSPCMARNQSPSLFATPLNRNTCEMALPWLGLNPPGHLQFTQKMHVLEGRGVLCQHPFSFSFFMKTSKKNYNEVWKSNSTPHLRSPRCLRGAAWSRKNTRLHAKKQNTAIHPKRRGKDGGSHRRLTNPDKLGSKWSSAIS